MASKSYHLPQEQEAKGFREAASASEGNLGLYDSVLGKPSIKPELLSPRPVNLLPPIKT